jgi:hypothetical protein
MVRIAAFIQRVLDYRTRHGKQGDYKGVAGNKIVPAISDLRWYPAAADLPLEMLRNILATTSWAVMR